MHPSGNSGGYFSCKPPSLVAFEVLLVYICVHLCVCGRAIMREQLYFSFLYTPPQTSGFNKGEKPLVWPVAPSRRPPAETMAVFCTRRPPGSDPETHCAHTLAVLLMLMPRSILLSSCKQRHGRAAPRLFNTLTGPWLKLHI